jgi:NADH dehydrogenase FAD-containing subunit
VEAEKLENSQVALNTLEAKGIKFLNDEITSIDPSKNSVTTKINHNKLEYDYLLVALGAEFAPRQINGLEDNDESCFNVYDIYRYFGREYLISPANYVIITILRRIIASSSQ